MLNQISFKHLLHRDAVPDKGTPLQKLFEENPRLLLEAVNYSSYLKNSVISLAYSLGNLNLADSLLKPNCNIFAANADPYYLGQNYLDLHYPLTSASVNFYLALTTWQIHFQQNRLPELVDETIPEEIKIKKTYYDKFYWKNENNITYHICDRININENSMFMRTQAEWFMRLAYKVFHLEAQLKKILHETKSTWLPNWFTPSSHDNAQEIHTTLGEYYLHIAYMEMMSHSAFVYFIKKSCYHYACSSNEYSIVHQKLLALVDQITSDPDRVWNETYKKQNESLKDCNITTRDYTIDATEAWSKAFNIVHENIINQGIPTSLRFMELNSARTSSTERSSQSSDDLCEEKKPGSQFDYIGLHQRRKESNIGEKHQLRCNK